MQYATEYVEQAKLQSKIMDYINHIRIYKKMLLPIELIGATGNGKIELFQTIEAKSIIE